MPCGEVQHTGGTLTLLGSGFTPGLTIALDGQTLASVGVTGSTKATAANLLVEDANGNVVYATTADTSAGSHSFLWNGQNLAGTTSPDGAYSLAVVAADATGKAISATVTATGKVDGVSVDNSVPTFDVGGVKVPMSDLLTVQPSSI